MKVATARPGRHRSPAADEAILAATLELLARDGYEGLTMSSVIERAGVSSATLYRRWPAKQDLVVAAVASLVPSAPEIDTGDLAGDVAALVESSARSIAGRREDVAEALRVEAARNGELADALRTKFLAPRLRQVEEILERAAGRGELATVPDAAVVLSLVIGPVYHRAFVLRRPMSAEFVRRAQAVAVAGLGVLADPQPDWRR